MSNTHDMEIKFALKGNDVRHADKVMNKMLKSLDLVDLELIEDAKIQVTQSDITVSSDIFKDEDLGI